MSNRETAPRRVSVDRNIYRRSTGVYEVGFKDGSGRQRWRTVVGGITAARAVRDEFLAQRGRGQRVASNARLRFGDAADLWLKGPVVDLRPATRQCYRNAVATHLVPRFASRRLDAISADDLAKLVRDLRTNGLAESTIVIVIGVTNRIYRYAARRLGWFGVNPVSLMLSSERPKPSQGKRRRVFEGRELEQTLTAADEPFRTLFTVAALTGARLSELLGLTWGNVRIADLDDAEIEFGWQVDRHGHRQPTKTDGSARTVPIPKQLAAVLARHRSRSTQPLNTRYVGPEEYVFSTRTGRPLGQRNVMRALRNAQTKATTEDGTPTYPILHERDGNGMPVPLPHGAVPSMHSFRHTVASRALLAGSASTRSHSSSATATPTSPARSIYVRELADARRRTMRRSRMVAEFGDVLGHHNND
jgi:integrase